MEQSYQRTVSPGLLGVVRLLVPYERPYEVDPFAEYIDMTWDSNELN